MKTKSILALFMVIGVLVLVGADCASPQPPDNTNTTPTTPPVTTTSKTPEEVVNEFYGEYLGALEDMAAGLGGSPIDEFKKHDLLTAANQTEIQATLDSMTGPGGYDPILCAQNFPDKSYIVGESIIGGDNANLTVIFFYGGDPAEVPVILAKENGEWKIDEIICLPPDLEQ